MDYDFIIGDALCRHEDPEAALDALTREPIRVILWTGGDAPNREAKLSVTPTYHNTFFAYWEPGYCGCEDCHPVTGEGATEVEAIVAYWEAWEEKYA